MIQFIKWLILMTLPLMLFLYGTKHNEDIVLISQIIYGIIIFIGLFSYNQDVINIFIVSDKKTNNILKSLTVPPWFTLLASMISAGNLIYFKNEILGILLLISSYGIYRLFGKIYFYNINIDKNQ